jgi:hypothetical protein
MEDILIKEIGNEWALSIPKTLSEKDLLLMLSEKINHLIQSDFNSLLTILYRIDIDEKKLKATLQQNPDEDAGLLIAEMVLSRQKQKLATRKRFRADQHKKNDGEEKW